MSPSIAFVNRSNGVSGFDFTGVSYSTMQTDKELALEFVDALADMQCREIIYQAILDAFPETATKWREHFDKHLQSRELRDKIRADFEPVRQQVLDAPDLSSAVRQMLEGLERIDP
jgi:hypothetical protein